MVIPGVGVGNGYTLAANLMIGLNSGRAVWPFLGIGLLADLGDPRSFLLPPSGPDVPAFLTANAVVDCADRNYPGHRGLPAGQLAVAAYIAPLLGPALAYGPPTYDHNHGTACAQWPVARPSRQTGGHDASGSAPLLVIGTTGDPDTPYHDAESLVRRLDNARLLTFRAEGRTAFERSACVRVVVTGYLVDRTLPATGTVCADEPA